MEPIQSVDPGAGRLQAQMIQPSTVRESTFVSTQTSSVTMTQFSRTTRTSSEVSATAAQLLQMVTQALDDNELLKALIALILLLAAMQKGSGSGDDSESAMSRLGGGRTTQEQFFSVYSSSSSYTFEQTNTDTSTQSLDAGQAAGGKLDISA